MRRAGVVAMAAALTASTLLVAGVVTAAPASAAVAVTVEPSDGLADGQPVTVTGTGFSPHVGVGTAECSAAVSVSRSTADCDLSNSRTGSADDDGSASFSLRLKRVIKTANGEIDCATSADPCIVGMGDINDLENTSSGKAITFNPNAPPLPPPSVSVSPRTDLVDRQQVAVTASGFIEGESVTVQQCAASDLSACSQNQYGGPGFGQADPTGSVAVGITVRRVVLVGGARLDCASSPGACVVTAQASGGPLGKAPLMFDDSTPLPPAPTMNVTPDTGLADRQIVSVSGDGFAPQDYVYITQCEKGASQLSAGCSSSVFRQAEIESNGTFSTTLQLRAKLDSYDPDTGQPRTIDCTAAAGACVVNVIDGSDATLTASAPISFDPDAPVIPPPTARASPSTGLTDGQSINVTAVGMPPGGSVVLVECKAGSTDQAGCDVGNLQSGIVDDHGNVDAAFVVKRVLSLNGAVPPPPVPTTTEPVTGREPAGAAKFFADGPAEPNNFDCAVAPGACTVAVAFLGATIEAATAPLTFDGAVPPPTTATTTPGAPGVTTVPVDSGAPGAPGATSVTAVAAAAATSTTARPSSGSALPRTGLAIGQLLQRVVVLLALGGVTLTVSRRRRSLAR